MSSLQRRILIGVGVLGFYFFCLFVFLRVTFPYETVRDRLLSEFNGSQSDRRLEIDELSGHWLFGVEAEGVRLVSLQQEPPATGEEKAPPPQSLAFDRLALSVSLLRYLFGTLVVDYTAEVGGGELEGAFSQSEEQTKFSLRAEDVEIASLSLIAASIGLPLGGVLSGEVELLLPERKMQKAEGRIELSIKDLLVGDGKAKVLRTIALPRIAAGDLTLKADVVQGRMDVTEFATSGPDFEMTSGGKVRLREPFERSAADLEVTFKFKDAYTTKSEITQGIFGSPDGRVPGLFDMDPQVRQAKTEDGSYRWRVSGMLSRPIFRPGGKSASLTK